MKSESCWLEVTSEPLQVSAAFEFVRDTASGAIDLFVGTVRDRDNGRPIRQLEYTGYAEMAESILAEIGSRAIRQWDVQRLAILHRLGLLEIGETSVIIAVSCRHRAEAFEACRFVIEEIKKDLPLWKKEYFGDGQTNWKNDP